MSSLLAYLEVRRHDRAFFVGRGLLSSIHLTGLFTQKLPIGAVRLSRPLSSAAGEESCNRCLYTRHLSTTAGGVHKATTSSTRDEVHTASGCDKPSTLTTDCRGKMYSTSTRVLYVVLTITMTAELGGGGIYPESDSSGRFLSLETLNVYLKSSYKRKGAVHDQQRETCT